MCKYDYEDKNDYDDDDYYDDDYDDDDTKKDITDKGEIKMVHMLNNKEDRDLSNLPCIIIKGYNPSNFYVGEVLYDVNKYIVEKARNDYGAYLTGSPVQVYDMEKKSLIKKDIKKPVDVYLDFSKVEWREIRDDYDDEDYALHLPEYGKIVKSNKEYYQYVLKCMKKCMDEIIINKFYSYPYITPLEQVMEACCDNDCELFLCEAFAYDSIVIDIEENYYMLEKGRILFTKEDRKKGKKLKKEVEKALKKIIKKGMSDIQKVKAIHSYLIKNCTYDTNLFSSFTYDGKVIKNPNEDDEDMRTAYGAIVKKRAICTGYASAFNIMALKSGLKSIMVSGTVRGDGKWQGHCWNAVKINGKIKYIDVTFDDPLSIDYKNPFKHLINNKKVYTRYLLKNASAMKKEHKWDVKAVNKYFKYIETSQGYKMYNKYCA